MLLRLSACNPRRLSMCCSVLSWILPFAKPKKLDSLLEFVDQAQSSPISQAIPQILATQALLLQDEGKISLLMEHFLSREQQTPVYFACRAFSTWRQGRRAEAPAFLKAGEQLLDDQAARAILESFSISQHFAWVWQAFALALAAWECQAWPLANKGFAVALSEAKINPVINRALADYLIEKARITTNANTLHILTHQPEQFSLECSDQESHAEQISIAGRYLPASEMLPALKMRASCL